jgi:transcriptional regulator with XRE-family HTH domain
MFSALLKEIRTKNRLTQDDLARVIGVSRTTVGEIERGGRDIELGELHKLAEYLDVDVADLVNKSEKPDSRLEKYKEMLLQTALSYRKKTGKDIPKTFLAKLIYLVDFAWFYEHLEAMSGMRYRRRSYGPVADEYYAALGRLVESGDIQTKQGRQAQWYRVDDSQPEPFVAQHLSVQEAEMIDRVVEKWKDADTAQIVEFTHTQLPWQICSPDEVIPYSLITQEEPGNVY